MIIREIEQKDRETVIDMMRGFYQSPAVLTNGSEEIYQSNVDGCIEGSDYLEGYVFDENGEILGYGMLARSYSTEFGKRCIWIEDLFVKEEYRHKGIGTNFFSFVEEKYPDHLYRLEVEHDNEKAIISYEKNGFSPLPYLEMRK